jgi:thiamine-monophosphate kinase
VNEFDLIRKFFTRATPNTRLGVGDDAALIAPTPGMELAVSTDLFIEGRHFSPADGPAGIGHKALAVNLSDMAAMGAVPRWALLSLALPRVDEAWLTAFARGLFRLADEHGVELIGGDTTRGPLAINIAILGEVPAGQALRRAGARAGDDVWVSGVIGSAACALAYRQGRLGLSQIEAAPLLPALILPTPRVALGVALRGAATACIDISDGLSADLGHILDASGVGARVDYAAIPVHETLTPHRDEAVVRDGILAGGDDYELCFTAPAEQRAAVLAASARASVAATRIGTIVAGAGLEVRDGAGRVIALERRGFDHFAGA